MRILQLTKKFPFPRKDGEAWAVLALAEGLSNSGAIMDLFSISPENHIKENESLDGLKRTNIYNQIHLTEADTNPRRLTALLNIFSTKSYHEERYDIKNVANALSVFVKDKSYDCIIAETVFMMSFAMRIKGMTNVILRAHNIEHLIWHRYAIRKGYVKAKYFKLQSERLKRYELDMMNKADAILPLSSYDNDLIHDRLGIKTKSMVAPIGMPTLDQVIKEKDGLPLIIGFIGSLDWRPNAEGIKWFIEEVWPLIFDSDREVRFMIAGRSGGDLEKFRSVDGVAVVGEVEDSNQFIRALDILVAPILSGSGTRVKILQSLSIGVPVVATTMAMEGLELHDNKEILVADAPSEWAKAIDQLADNLELWLSISKGGQSYLKRNHNVLSIGSAVKSFISKI